MKSDASHEACPSPRFIIVCPTSTGGHMDHSMDLALGAVAAGFRKTTIVSREGSRAYATGPVRGSVEIVEAIPSLVPKEARGISRLIQMLFRLVLEHISIWKAVVSDPGGSVALVFQEPRYPAPILMRLFHRSPVTTTLILHNAVEHAGGADSLGGRIQAAIRRRCIRRVDHVLTFGEAQAEIARGMTAKRVSAATLPVATRLATDDESSLGGLQAEGAALCIGEIRSNKGIEIAIAAAVRSRSNLLVVGRNVDDAYYDSICQLAESAEGVSVVSAFLSPSQFDQAIRKSRCVVLPYTQFNAQSGVLAKAIAFGKEAIVSDLPSLREQAEGAPFVKLVPPSDEEALATALKDVLTSEAVRTNFDLPSVEEWDTLAKLCASTL